MLQPRRSFLPAPAPHFWRFSPSCWPGNTYFRVCLARRCPRPLPPLAPPSRQPTPPQSRGAAFPPAGPRHRRGTCLSVRSRHWGASSAAALPTRTTALRPRGAGPGRVPPPPPASRRPPPLALRRGLRQPRRVSAAPARRRWPHCRGGCGAGGPPAEQALPRVAQRGKLRPFSK